MAVGGVQSLFQSILQDNPHFSEEERRIGKQILEKLEILKQEALDDKPINFLWNLIRGQEDCIGSSKSGHEGNVLKTYTKKQWNLINPDKPLPRVWMKFADYGPKRYWP
jgi:hypothetical protein